MTERNTLDLVLKAFRTNLLIVFIKINRILGFDQSLTVKRYVLILAAVWTAAIVILFNWHRADVTGHMSELARIQAVNSFNKDLIYRRWSAAHGGVYVPPTEETPPNPYLSHIKTRDITTTDGMDLTLMNPAYMTRQVHELGKEQYGLLGHITSLNPLRPGNEPDAWEVEALRAFERGETNVVEIASIGNEEYLRLMRPLITEKRCLKCHASQGYKEGDLRGGISVSVPIAPLQLIMQKQVYSIARGYALIWLLGVCGLGFGSWRIRSLTHQRSLADQALRESEEKFRALYDNAPLAYQSLDESGCFIDVNPTWLKTLGYELDEVIGQCFVDFLHQDWKPHFKKNFSRFKRLGSVHDVEYKIRHKGGYYLDVLFEGCIGYLPDGRFFKTYCVFQDITARKQAGKDLKESEERYRALHNATFGGIAIHSKGIILECNRGLSQITGYSVEELVGMDGLLLIAEQTRKEVMDNISSGYEKSYEVIGVRKDGEEYPLRLEGRNIPYKGQDVRVVEFRDITERKRSEEALRESQKLLEDILNAIPVRVFWKDINLLYQGCNKAFASDAGFSHQQEVVGKNDSQMVWKDQAERYNADDLRVIAGETILDSEEPQTTPEGEIIVLLTSKVPLRNSQGQIIGILGAYMDISEQRKTEAQLQQAQKMESIGRLAGGVAHDFNNMLQVILGYTDMALKETDPKSALYNDLTESRTAASRAATLTRQLLAFARKQTMTPKVLDLNETVCGMLMMLRQLIGEDIDLTWQPTAADTTVKMDPAQIDQILANLCVNARDAIAGVGKLKVETGTLTADANFCAMTPDLVPGEYVTLSVSDTGCGMEPEMLEYIFEPFYTTKDVGEGTGLGLATVYGIVKQNNGSINLTSVPGKGTTFRLFLPRHCGESMQVSASGPAKAALRGHDTVLLVEDEPLILEMGKRMLESLGYRVLTAGLPDEAIAMAEEHAGEIHLLLTDVVMPQMNGLDLAIRLTLFHPKIKHMFMSGYTADIIAKQGLIEEGMHFIQKPFTIQDLAAKVRDVLGHERL
ncbi:MAG: PAS domain S-box protein [Kiritimatiellae bacterium]|jgi:PAS domain S-box-containing protein|nr:PAS domain S-box protein [Kiritimatiellia bacterium]